MRQKYCIIPQKGNAFWRLVQGMELTDEQKSLFKSCRIKHVEVSLKSNSWEILLQTNELMPSELLASAADYIAQKCKINGVTFYQDVIDLEASIEKSWKKLVEVAANGNHTVFHLLKQAKRVVDGSHLTIEVGGELGGKSFGPIPLPRSCIRHCISFWALFVMWSARLLMKPMIFRMRIGIPL